MKKDIVLTLGELMGLIDPINVMLDRELPFSTSYKLMQIADQVDEHSKRYQKLNEEMIKKYGKKEEGREDYQIPEKDKKDFLDDRKKLLDSEIEVSIPALTQEEVEKMSIKPRHLMALKKLIEFSEKELD